MGRFDVSKLDNFSTAMVSLVQKLLSVQANARPTAAQTFDICKLQTVEKVLTYLDPNPWNYPSTKSPKYVWGNG